MCLIVDANVASSTFAPEPAPEFKPILDALRSGEATAVYGGKLTEEYAKLGPVRRFIAALDRAGRARQVPAAQIEAEMVSLQVSGSCRSNDHHILAIARVGRVRLLCSRDQAL